MVLKIAFGGQREDRNYVDRLKSQKSALNMNSQRNIKNAIENLSHDSSSENLNFLMNVAEQIKYGLNAGITDIKPNNNWKEQLRNATESGIAKNNTSAQQALKERFEEVFNKDASLSQDEKDILDLRKNLLDRAGLKNDIKTSENENVQNIESNLNYFIISSEVSTEEKKNILKKLNYFMSDEYKIQEQLKDKKSQVLGEMLNDLVVKREDQDRPTIKQVDQRFHGMCAAISTARKTMAYEYKPEFVQMIMNELNDSDTMKVYDISKLGSGKKLSVPKTYIDYDYAEQRGYRIIDASTLNWMNIAGNTGDGTTQSKVFMAFDKENFDTFHDAFYNQNFSDKNLADVNNQLRAMLKAKEVTDSTIRKFTNRKIKAMEQVASRKENLDLLAQSNRILSSKLKELMPGADDKSIHSTVNELIRLNTNEYKKQMSPFYIVDAEEDYTKKQKISKFIESKYPEVNKEQLAEKLDSIYDLYKNQRCKRSNR